MKRPFPQTVDYAFSFFDNIFQLTTITYLESYVGNILIFAIYLIIHEKSKLQYRSIVIELSLEMN